MKEPVTDSHSAAQNLLGGVGSYKKSSQYQLSDCCPKIQAFLNLIIYIWVYIGRIKESPPDLRSSEQNS